MRFTILLALLCAPAVLHASDLEEEAVAYHRNFQTEDEGVVLGRLLDGEPIFAAAGRLRTDGPSVDPDTLFEIGSITKVFTATLLADAVLKGQATLEDPVTRFLPADWLTADSPLQKVTLLDLTTHTSGLLRLPKDLASGADPADPYAHFTVERLRASLRSLTEEDFETRGTFAYSNLGVGLLGVLLEKISGKPYESLLAETILAPLGMTSTFVQRAPDDLPVALAPRFATGHSGGKPVSHWHLASLSGAGAIVSSARDLMQFARARWAEETPDSLREAMALAARPQRGDLGLGWFVGKDGLSHDGGTGGFRSELRIDPARKSASLKLVNSAGPTDEAAAQGDFHSLSGIWEGSLDTGVGKLRLLFRIADSGRIVLHSLDQGGGGIPASKSVFGERTLTTVFSELGGSFQATLEGDALDGIWNQVKPIPLSLTRRADLPEELTKALSKRVTGEMTSLTGYWSGYLGGNRVLLHILEIEAIGETGEARIYSPDQSPGAIAVSSLVHEGETVTLGVDSINATYRATLTPEGLLKGSWQQGPAPIPLELRLSRDRPHREP